MVRVIPIGRDRVRIGNHRERRLRLGQHLTVAVVDHPAIGLQHLRLAQLGGRSLGIGVRIDALQQQGATRRQADHDRNENEEDRDPLVGGSDGQSGTRAAPGVLAHRCRRAGPAGCRRAAGSGGSGIAWATHGFTSPAAG
ncbi:hypothetical protein SDC9_153838 [bioreactor metagenome]|uniref:Uncharacterized protein n=1 Tax=bioreactor metagenome TaxID=1076179 RepID=A0A645EZ98_9ZZZZ